MSNRKAFLSPKRRRGICFLVFPSILKIVTAGMPIMGLAELCEFYGPGAYKELHTHNSWTPCWGL